MASNNPTSKFVTYTFNWRIDCAQYEKIGNSTPANRPRKYFVVAFNNVVFQWNAYFRKSNVEDSRIGFGIAYDDGPLETIKGVEYKVGIVKSDGSVRVIPTGNRYDLNRGKGGAIDNFDDKDLATVRTKYGLNETDALVYNITLRISMEAFAYSPTPTPSLLLSRHADRFSLIQTPESSKFYDAVLISGDGVKFYCHKVIVGQTEPLDTMLSDPLASLEESNPPTKGRGTKRKKTESDNDGASSANEDLSTTAEKKRGYKFKEMSTSTLKALIEYLYTGQSTLTELTVTEIIGLANAAEQYLLKPLKELCVVHLWKYVVDKPDSAFEIARFADLHDDCKYLKHRAMDVIVENYQNLNIRPKFLHKRFGGTRGEELSDELLNYMERRLRPCFGP